MSLHQDQKKSNRVVEVLDISEYLLSFQVDIVINKSKVTKFYFKSKRFTHCIIFSYLKNMKNTE